MLNDIAALGLAALADNGGPTQTMALEFGSPAIHAGTSAVGVSGDQRGQPLDIPRPDIGAFQTQSASTLVVSSESDDGSIGTLRWAVSQANSAANASTIEFELGTAPAKITLLLGQLELSGTAGMISIYNGPGQGPVTISGNNVSRVLQVDGGVTAVISGLTITGGSTLYSGGGLFNQGTTTLTGCTIVGNRSASPIGFTGGAGVANRNNLTLDHCLIRENTAAGDGGGLLNFGIAELVDCTVSGNSAAVHGGGISNYSRGSVTVIRSTISDNSGSRGGGVCNLSYATLIDCTISGNSAQYGGGLIGAYGAATVLTACTISGNSASIRSGGAYNSGSSWYPSRMSFSDTIVAGNTGVIGQPDDIGGDRASAVTGSYNLIGTGGSGGIVDGSEGNIVLTSLEGLGLAPLANNGGPTETMALMRGSRAILAGITIAGITTDQRGQPLDAPVCDIGAFQTQIARIVVTSTADDGSTGTLRWAVEQANSASVLTTIDVELGAEPAVITLTQGQLELTNTMAPVVIVGGPGQGSVTINGNNTSRVFHVDMGVTATFTRLMITGGATSGSGGGIYNQGTATFSDCTIAGNTSTASAFFAGGGGIFSSPTALLTLERCLISENATTEQGGGVFIYLGRAAVIECTISGNSAAGSGGGLFGYSTDFAIKSSTVSGNYAREGGGVYNDYKATLTNCTISGNRAQFAAGVEAFGTTNLTACTISGNVASQGGGGINNDGTATYTATTTLTDTIVAGNFGSAGLPDDISGNQPAGVNGSYNLIGTGGSGGIAQGADGNIVLTDLALLRLAPLGNYGGITQTMALLPGSPALGTGTLASGVSFDERGEPMSGSPDIGAFQSQGFTVTAYSGSTPQTAAVGGEFATALAVFVTATNPVEPVAGGLVTYSVYPSSGGAAADLGGLSASIGANGLAQVGATANAAPGTYTVNASTTGAAASISFSLTNVGSPAFSGLTGLAATYGGHATLGGTISSGTVVPSYEYLNISIGGVTQQAFIGFDGTFTATFDLSGLSALDSPYTITYSYAGDFQFTPQSTTALLSVLPATPKVRAVDAGGTYNQRAFPATAAIAGVNGTFTPDLEGVSTSFSYYAGVYTSAAQLGGAVALSVRRSSRGRIRSSRRFPAVPTTPARRRSLDSAFHERHHRSHGALPSRSFTARRLAPPSLTHRHTWQAPSHSNPDWARSWERETPRFFGLHSHPPTRLITRKLARPRPSPFYRRHRHCT